MEPFDTYTHAGVVIELHQDIDAIDPRKDYDHNGIILSFTSAFEGDEYLSVSDDLSNTCPVCDGEGCSNCDNGTYYGTLQEYIKYQMDDVAIMQPLRFSDYGSSGCQLGETSEDNANAVIYMTTVTLLKEFNGDYANAWKAMISEIDEYNVYLQGEVFGYVIKGPDGEDLPDQFYDSCWGFIGEVAYVKKEAENAAEHVSKMLEKESTERAEMASRDIITV